MKNDKKPKFLTFKEVNKLYEKQPPQKFLWNGIKENATGLVFGPSKSGKTILCENLAMSLAIGKKSFLGYPLSGTPLKVLFIGLEEFWLNRIDRNRKQIKVLSDSERKLYEENYQVQAIDFLRQIVETEHWDTLKDTIKSSQAKVVVIDSITRMNHGKLEDSKVAQEIMQNLRDLSQELGITMICIHHTHKIGGQRLLMDSIKGSSVFSQESDFAIGVNKTGSGRRYLKNVFFRYAPDDSEIVREFSLDENTRVNYLGDESELELLYDNDGRRDDTSRQAILEFFNLHPCKEFETSKLVPLLESKLPIKERQIKDNLRELVKSKKLLKPRHGVYKSNNCINEAGDEEE